MEEIHLFINGPLRYMICITLSFMAGILLYMADIAVFLYICVFLTILVLIILFVFIIKKLKGQKLSGYLRLSLLVSLFVLFGMFRVSGFDYDFTKRLKTLSTDDALYMGIALSDAKPVDENMKTITVFVLNYKINNEQKELNENIEVYFEKDGFDEILPGDYVEFYGKPANSDTRFIINRKSKNTLAGVYSSACVEVDNKGEVIKKITFGQRLKVSIKKAVGEIFGYNPEYSAIVTGILTGDTADFSENLNSGFRSGGFAHTVAVSGLHVSLLYLLIAYILEKLKVGKTIISVLGIIVIFAFCGVAGYTASSIRAAIMIAVRISAFYVKREYDILSSLFFAAFVILIYNPYKIFTAGFLLSFGATLGIAVYNKLFDGAAEYIKALKYVPLYIRESVNLSVSAFLGTMPFCLYFFGNINFASIITNLWIIMSITIIFALSGVACVFYHIFPWVSLNVIRYFCEPFLLVVSKTAKFFQSHNTGVVEYSYIPSGVYAFVVSLCVSVYIIFKYINIRLEK